MRGGCTTAAALCRPRLGCSDIVMVRIDHSVHRRVHRGEDQRLFEDLPQTPTRILLTRHHDHRLPRDERLSRRLCENLRLSILRLSRPVEGRSRVMCGVRVAQGRRTVRVPVRRGGWHGTRRVTGMTERWTASYKRSRGSVGSRVRRARARVRVVRCVHRVRRAGTGVRTGMRVVRRIYRVRWTLARVAVEVRIVRAVCWIRWVGTWFRPSAGRAQVRVTPWRVRLARVVETGALILRSGRRNLWHVFRWRRRRGVW